MAWKRMSDQPVLFAGKPWEKVAVMCPHVLWDDQTGLFRMWYSGGEQYEPDAIGYATSPDGMHWTDTRPIPSLRRTQPALGRNTRLPPARSIRREDWHVMFYIGFRDVHHAQIGLARSRDGITTGSATPPTRSSAPARTIGTTMPATNPLPSSTAQMAAVVQRPPRRLGTDRRSAPRRGGSRVLACGSISSRDHETDRWHECWLLRLKSAEPKCDEAAVQPLPYRNGD